MALSKENIDLIRAAAKDAGDHLNGKLPPCKFLKKRNSYAHIWERLKSRLGRSYKDCEDWETPRILEMIDWYKNNPC
jgi:hypothetical protein